MLGRACFLVALVGLLLCAVAPIVVVTATVSHNGCQCTTSCDDASVAGISLSEPFCVTKSDCCPECFGGKVFGRCIGVCYDKCTPPPPSPPAIVIWFNDIKNNFENFFDDVSDATRKLIEEEVRQLPPDVQEIIDKANQLKTATRVQLDQMSGVVLAHLKEAAQLTANQLKTIAARAHTWATDELQKFLSKVSNAAFKDSIREWGCFDTWTPDQRAVLRSKAISALGAVTGWSESDITEMGHLVKTLAAGDLSALPAAAKKAAVLTGSLMSGLTPDKLEALAGRAKEVYGEVKTWDQTTWRGMGELVKGLAAGDLGEADEPALQALARVAGWNEESTVALATRTANLIGDLKSGDDEQWQLLAAYAAGVSEDKLKQAPRGVIRALAQRLPGDVELSVSQYTALADRAVELLGTPEGWDKEAWRDIGEAARGLAVEDLRNIKAEGIAKLADKIPGLSMNQLTALWDRCKELQMDECGQATIGLLGKENAAVLLTNAALETLGSNSMVTAYASEIKTLALKVLPERGETPAETLRLLGQNVLALTQEDFAGLQVPDWREAKLDSLARELVPDQFAGVLTAAKAVMGDDPSQWTPEKWSKLGALGLGVAARLSSSAASSMSSITLSRDSIAAIGAQVKSVSVEQISSELRSTIMSALGPAADWQAEDWNAVGAMAKALLEGDIDTLSETALPFIAKHAPATCDNTPSFSLDKIDFSGSQLRAMMHRWMTLKGSISTWDAAAFESLGGAVRGMSAADFEEISETAVPILAKVTCWNKEQLECLANRATRVLKAGEGLAAWGREEFDKMKGLVKGLKPQQLKTLSKAQFEALAETVKDLKLGWSSQQALELAAAAKRSWGEQLSSWSTASIERVIDFLHGFNREEVRQVAVVALDSQAQAVVSTVMCDHRRLTDLSADQLLVLGAVAANNTACEEQIDHLTPSQMTAVEQSVTAAGGAGSGGGLDGGAIAGIVIGVLFLVGVSVGGVWYYRKQNTAKTVKSMRSSQGGQSPA